MSQVISKVCRLCGKDVARLPRTKDTLGNYYCQPCYSQATVERDDSSGNMMTESASNPSALRAVSQVQPLKKVRTPLAWWKRIILAVLAIYLSILLLGLIAQFVIYIVPPVDEKALAEFEAEQRELEARYEAKRKALFESGNASCVPSVSVRDADGGLETSVSFSGWHKKDMNYGLHGVATWNGDLAIDEMRYEVKKGGVRIRSGRVYVTGGYLRKNEPTAVSLSIGEEPTADMSISIEVQH